MAGQRGEIRPPSVALRRLCGCSEARTLAHRENSPGVQAFQARRGRPPVRPLRRPGNQPRSATAAGDVELDGDTQALVGLVLAEPRATANAARGASLTPPGIHDENPSCETALSSDLSHPPDSAINSQFAQAGIWRLLRAPACFIERLAAELPDDGLSSPRLIELLIEHWYVADNGAAHDLGLYLAAVPIARTADERWVQLADRRAVIPDTSTHTRADAIRRRLAVCTAS